MKKGTMEKHKRKMKKYMKACVKLSKLELIHLLCLFLALKQECYIGTGYYVLPDIRSDPALQERKGKG